MATRKRAQATRANTHNSDSGPSRIDPRVAAHEADVRALPSPQGAQVEPPSESVSVSTLSETNPNARTGQPAVPGDNPLVWPLERVRMDGSLRAFTSNQSLLCQP